MVTKKNQFRELKEWNPFQVLLTDSGVKKGWTKPLQPRYTLTEKKLKPMTRLRHYPCSSVVPESLVRTIFSEACPIPGVVTPLTRTLYFIQPVKLVTMNEETLRDTYLTWIFQPVQLVPSPCIANDLGSPFHLSSGMPSLFHLTNKEVLLMV